jgi:hypothetical protein
MNPTPRKRIDDAALRALALAEKIADDLMGRGRKDHQPADRLVLWDDEKKRELSGWARGPLVDRILKHLQPDADREAFEKIKVSFRCPACCTTDGDAIVLGAIFADPTHPCLRCNDCGMEWRINLYEVEDDGEDDVE